jgi:hypothetical protein
MIDLTPVLKEKILYRYDYTCQKCGYKDETCEGVRVHVIPQSFTDRQYNEEMLTVLCIICGRFAPQEEKYFKTYITEKIDWKVLETYRKALQNTSKRTRKGMQKALLEGKTVHRPPLGYKIIEGKMVIDEEKMRIVRAIISEYNSGVGLRELGRKYGLSAPGIKKLVENKVYERDDS